ncbi:ABC transporter substrate-binding protein [Mangrovicoccus algicola]|uniref:Peptide ABC transporter substrate-binding protein n=1 Tax=Mangrovicoccus algicola TaxID=2771008 RepID=A0A8J7CWK6_9RHOB|nr:ABC transporter substrate-binding protein [Mangrovicoccus algicola]MBE3639809.1 peptide ABC transporter substrate-binding protein [Mangrovicoccus algicola]
MKIRNTLLCGAAFAWLALPALAADGTVTIVLNEELETLEPCMASQSNIGRVLLQNISETMTELDPSNGELLPRLATSWEETDDSTWRFALREGVTFSDGSSFDAADVKHSVERTLSDQLTCEIGAKYFGGMEITATVVDDLTIDIASDPAQPILPLLMSTLTIVPSETAMEFTRDPVGTGPYVLEEYRVGQDITLTRRDGYWGETPAVEKATYLFRTDDAVRAAMVATGEADIAPLISQTDATNKATDFAYPNSETTYLRIDSSLAPLDDIRVRQALNMAVDREAFLGTLIPEDAKIATHMTVPTTLGADGDLEVPAYDPEGAKALLEEARADGVPVDTEILLIGRLGNFPNVTEVMEALQAMFADAGFNAKLQMVEVAEWIKYYSKPFAAGDTPALVAAMHDNNRGDPVFSMYFKYACDGLQSGMCDAELDAAIAEATGTAGAGRAEAWRTAFARAHALSADVFLFHMVGFSRVSERLDFTPSIATNSELQLAQIGFK